MEVIQKKTNVMKLLKNNSKQKEYQLLRNTYKPKNEILKIEFIRTSD
jgi:hypothetical protein